MDKKIEIDEAWRFEPNSEAAKALEDVARKSRLPYRLPNQETEQEEPKSWAEWEYEATERVQTILSNSVSRSDIIQRWFLERKAAGDSIDDAAFPVGWAFTSFINNARWPELQDENEKWAYFNEHAKTLMRNFLLWWEVQERQDLKKL